MLGVVSTDVRQSQLYQVLQDPLIGLRYQKLRRVVVARQSSLKHA